MSLRRNIDALRDREPESVAVEGDVMMTEITIKISLKLTVYKQGSKRTSNRA